ncbi:Primary amine oxidase [Senna tora]|uniref:Primary amine oxidase n=1 Tax=Senna tora TaxID=362788 RepID=A0A834X3G8_9FABA|nr:Primary amine oxidase [Senna tora]
MRLKKGRSMELRPKRRALFGRSVLGVPSFRHWNVRPIKILDNFSVVKINHHSDSLQWPHEQVGTLLLVRVEALKVEPPLAVCFSEPSHSEERAGHARYVKTPFVDGVDEGLVFMWELCGKLLLVVAKRGEALASSFSVVTGYDKGSTLRGAWAWALELLDLEDSQEMTEALSGSSRPIRRRGRDVTLGDEARVAVALGDEAGGADLGEAIGNG